MFRTRTLLSLVNRIRTRCVKTEIPVTIDTLSYYNFHKKDSRMMGFYKDDLLIRLAKRSQELESLSYGLSCTSSVSSVIDWYLKSFQEVEKLDIAKSENFCPVLQNIYDRHAPTLTTMGDGVNELKNILSRRYNENIEPYNLKGFNTGLDTFYTNRLSVRLLISHYLNFVKYPENKRYIGAICLKTSPYEILRDAINNSTDICENTYGISPSVEVEHLNNLEFPYIPSHLYYVLFEVMKNSLRATVESYSDINNPLKDDDNLPPIKVVISGGEDIVIKISDLGGGISSDNIDKVWYYSYTTVKHNLDMIRNDFDRTSPLAGFGYGLSISRAIIRFLGGDIKLMSVEGHGTDVYIYL